MRNLWIICVCMGALCGEILGSNGSNTKVSTKAHNTYKLQDEISKVTEDFYKKWDKDPIGKLLNDVRFRASLHHLNKIREIIGNFREQSATFIQQSKGIKTNIDTETFASFGNQLDNEIQEYKKINEAYKADNKKLEAVRKFLEKERMEIVRASTLRKEALAKINHNEQSKNIINQVKSDPDLATKELALATKKSDEEYLEIRKNFDKTKAYEKIKAANQVLSQLNEKTEITSLPNLLKDILLNFSIFSYKLCACTQNTNEEAIQKCNQYNSQSTLEFLNKFNTAIQTVSTENPVQDIQAVSNTKTVKPLDNTTKQNQKVPPPPKKT